LFQFSITKFTFKRNNEQYFLIKNTFLKNLIKYQTLEFFS